MKITVLLICTLAVITVSDAFPLESELGVVELKTKVVTEEGPAILLDLDEAAVSGDSGEELKRTARGLGFGGHGGGFSGGLGGKFGGLGGFGHGFGGFGHGLGGGLGGLGGGFKKPFSFKGF